MTREVAFVVGSAVALAAGLGLIQWIYIKACERLRRRLFS